MNAEKLYLQIINSIDEGVYFVDLKRRIIFWNKMAETITGFTASEAIGSYCQNNLLNHMSKEGTPLCLLGCPLFSTLEDGKIREDTVILRHKEGHHIPVNVKIIPVYENDSIIGAFEIFSLVSSATYDDDIVAVMSKNAMRDSLTDMPNRHYLTEFLNYKIRESSLYKKNFCVMFLDIDNFSSFNNSYGHDVGDVVLKNISSTLNKLSRKNDIVGRWGGEEFLGIYEIKNENEIENLGENIRATIENSNFQYENRNFKITASLGITAYKKGDTLETIIKRADSLMFQGKKTTKNCSICG